MKYLLCMLVTGLGLAAEPNLPSKPYPLEFCPVSDGKLGSMGKPVVFVYQDQEIRLCCQECRKEFDATPAKFLAKLESKPKPAEKPSQPSVSEASSIRVTVDGLVCNFCAANIYKSFEKAPGVTSVLVNLKMKTILLTLRAGATLTDKQIGETVAEAGFTLREVRRTSDSTPAK